VVLTPEELYAVRDPRGFRPLNLGKLTGSNGEETWIVASETCAFDLLNAQYVRQIAPGEMVRISRSGIESIHFAPEKQHQFCIFEHVYFARPDSTIFGRSVNESREMLGRLLAREHPVDADIVVPVPDSGVPAAVGYAMESRIPFRMGLIRNHYIGRTFIEPSQAIRNFGVKLKLNPVKSLIEGQRVILVDDSIVRGTTSRKIVRMVREAGAREVHVRISCPPTISPCYYGVDTPTREELIASSNTPEEICKFLGADSLGYVSLNALKQAVGDTDGRYCTSCYTGIYPTDLVQLEVREGASNGKLTELGNGKSGEALPVAVEHES
jgi:amidophosphoribosyltransferase